MISDLKLESDDVKELMQSRWQFNIELQKVDIVKDDEGYNGKFVSLEKIQEITNAIMIPLGLMIEQTTVCADGSEYLITTLHHVPSGQFRRSIGWLFKEESGMASKTAEEFGGILTYKQRYQWRCILGVGRGEDAAKMKPRNQQPPSKPAQQLTVGKLAPMSPDHQRELRKILKDDQEAIDKLCNMSGGKQLGDLADSSFESIKKGAIKLAAVWDI